MTLGAFLHGVLLAINRPTTLYPRFIKLSASVELSDFWRSCGVRSSTHLHQLTKQADTRRSLGNPSFLSKRLKEISCVLKEEEDSMAYGLNETAQLIARAPTLLRYDPVTLDRKLETLREYLIGINVFQMVRKQPTLLLRDVDTAVPLKLKILLDTFDDDDECVANLVTKHPAILFISADKLLSRVDEIAALFLTPHNDRDHAKILAKRILMKAPSLFSYNINTIVSTMDQWRSLFFSTEETMNMILLAEVWVKMPTLLQCDTETNIAPKVRILRKVLNLEGEALVDLIVANPSYLAYARLKFGRLLFESEYSIVDPNDARSTLRRDKDLSSWLHRTGHSHEEYYNWLASRLSSDEIASFDHPKNNEADDAKAPLLLKSKYRALSSMEKAHGSALSSIELAHIADLGR